MFRHPRYLFNPSRLLVLAFAFIHAWSALRAQPEYGVREWHTKDGLPSEEVSQICLDRKGYLWLATPAGLVRFDGTQFLPVPADGREVHPPMGFRLISEAPRFGMIVAPYKDGVAAYSDGKYHMLYTADALGRRRVTTLFVESDDTFWLALADGALLRRSGDETRWFEPVQGFSGRNFTSFSIDREGRLWVTRGARLMRWEAGQLVEVPVDFGDTPLRIAASRNGGLWVVTNQRIHRFDGRGFDVGITLPPRLGAHFILNVLEDSRGALWIGTRSRGVHVVREGRITPVPASHEEIDAMLEDRDGNLWLGTNGGGLNRVRIRTSRLYDTAAGLLGNYSYTVCEDAAGAVWLANRDGGVVRIVGGEAEVLAHREGWPSFAAVSVVPDPRGGIWVSSGVGFYRIGPAVDHAEKRKARSGPDPIIPVMFTGRNGDIWHSVDRSHIGRIRGGERFELLGLETGYPGGHVRGLAEDQAGVLWIGTADGRLYRYFNDAFLPVELPAGEDTTAIQSILIEPTGIVWLGTAGTGLLARIDGVWCRADARRGLPDDNITQIQTDDYGSLWLGTNRGIFRANRAELIDAMRQSGAAVHAVSMGGELGLEGVSCQGLYQPAALKASDGRIWFATRRGTVVFDPRPEPGTLTLPKVAIEELRNGGRSLPLKEQMELGPAGGRIEIRFSALSLSAPEQMRVMYRLDGFDDDWIVDHGRRVATYPRLPPGEYLFHVAAANAGGRTDLRGAQLRFTIAPRWWETDVFRLLMTAMLGGIVTVAVRIWSHQRLRSRLERVEREHAIERERTRIARNIHDDLGASLTRISLLSQSARRESAPPADRLEEIYATAAEITRSLDEVVWAVNPKFDDLESLAGYLGNFAQKFLSAAGLRCRLRLPEQLPPIALTSQARHSLFLCCKEALHNVVKHARATEVMLTLAVTSDEMTITIADNGRGLAGSVDDKRAEDRISSGNGLLNMNRRLLELGGSCTIIPSPTGGTTVTFSVPRRTLG